MITLDTYRPFFGIVENINDPEKLDRVQVRVIGYHTDNKALLPTEMLKWMHCGSSGYASISGIGKSNNRYVCGSTVFGFFIESDLQEGIILCSFKSNRLEQANTNKGFFDPNGIFPKFINESDVSRIARNENTSETIVQKKKDSKVSGIPDAKGGTWSEPDSAYNTQYPYNDVLETESGHVIEIDDTPDSERISINHRKGTFEEFFPDGTKLDKIVKDNFELTVGDKYVFVNGECNIVVAGDCKTHVMGENYIKCDKTIFDGNVVILGTSEASDHISSEVSGAYHIHAGVLPGPAYTQVPYIAIPNLFQPTPANNFSFDADEAEWDADKVQTALSKGYITQEEADSFTSEPVISQMDVTTTTETPRIIDEECPVIDESNIDYTLQLSTNYTLKDLTLLPAVSNFRVKAQNGLTSSQIVCNLKSLSINVIEKLRAQFPNMIITSCFRQGSGVSQHYKGEAIDIQFRNADKAFYYSAAQWIKNNVPYDQLLLEYKSYGTRYPWIHISYKRKVPLRYQVLTLWNHRTHSSGLVDLSNN